MTKKRRTGRPKKPPASQPGKSQADNSKTADGEAAESPEEILFELIQLQHGYYQQVLEISTNENQKLANPDSIKEIQPLQKLKQEIMKSIQELEEVLNPLKQQWLRKSDRTANLDRKIEAEMAAVNQVLSGILQMDLKSHKLMQVYLSFLKNKVPEGGSNSPKVEPEG